MRAKLVSLKDSIATRLLRVVFSFYLILAVAVTTAHIAAEYLHTRNLVLQELETLEQTFQPSLDQALWEMNNNQLQSTLIGIMHLPNIVGVEIVDPAGKYLGEMGEVLHLSDSAVFKNTEGNQGSMSGTSGFYWNTFKIHHIRGDKLFLVGVVTIVQLENRLSTEPGTGLGLALCKQYTDLMGGTIHVAGETGNGSVFYVEIPVTELPCEDIPDETQRGRVIGLAEGQPRYRLLIAEDQPENRLLLRKLLEPFGFDLREAVNGQEAVALFEQWCPHLIWMDIRMPVMNGLEATRHIRKANAGAKTRIVAVTAHALEKERREILAAGCDDFIRKPYRDADIHDALTRNLGVRFIYEEEQPAADSALGLNAGDLAGLPDGLLREMEKTLVRLDVEAVNHTIESIRAHHPEKADVLGIMARDLQFGRILKMIRAASSITDI